MEKKGKPSKPWNEIVDSQKVTPKQLEDLRRRADHLRGVGDISMQTLQARRFQNRSRGTGP